MPTTAPGRPATALVMGHQILIYAPWLSRPGDDDASGQEIGQVAVAAHEREHVIGLASTWISFIRPYCLPPKALGAGCHPPLPSGIIEGIADVDRQIAVGIGMGRRLPQGVGGEDLHAGLRQEVGVRVGVDEVHRGMLDLHHVARHSGGREAGTGTVARAVTIDVAQAAFEAERGRTGRGQPPADHLRVDIIQQDANLRRRAGIAGKEERLQAAVASDRRVRVLLVIEIGERGVAAPVGVAGRSAQVLWRKVDV